MVWRLDFCIRSCAEKSQITGRATRQEKEIQKISRTGYNTLIVLAMTKRVPITTVVSKLLAGGDKKQMSRRDTRKLPRGCQGFRGSLGWLWNIRQSQALCPWESNSQAAQQTALQPTLLQEGRSNSYSLSDGAFSYCKSIHYECPPTQCSCPFFQITTLGAVLMKGKSTERTICELGAFEESIFQIHLNLYNNTEGVANHALVVCHEFLPLSNKA